MPVVNVTEIFSKETKTKLPFSDTIDALIEGYPCIAFSKSYCPYNAALKDLLALNYGVLLLVIDINQAGSAKDIQQYLCSKTGISTVPQVFVDGEYFGNHDSILELHMRGKLAEKLGKHATKDGSTNTGVISAGSYAPLFWFPTTINKWAIRATGLLSCVASSLLAYLMFTAETNASILVGLLSVSLFGDFVLRFFSGSKKAPIAKLGGKLALSSTLTPIPRPGAPKQFASLCGTMFSGIAALSYIFYGSPTTAGFFLVILALCTGMEGALDFCLGCKFFAIGEYLLSKQSTKPEGTNHSKRSPKQAAAA